MRNPPSCPQRGDMARGAAIRLGATPLAALVVGYVASFASTCWIKDWEVAQEITQSNGRNPHPKSVARARRQAARDGLMVSIRLGPGARVPGKARPVTYGSTAKIVVFGPRFGVKDPLRRGERRKLRSHLEALHAEYAPPAAVQKGEAKPGYPKYSAPPVSFDVPERVAATDPELAALLTRVGKSLELRQDRVHAAEDARMVASAVALRRAGRGPPDTEPDR